MELSKLKQRLELLYQEVEKLEAEGGGGSGGDSYTKAQTDALLATKVDKVQGSSLMTTAQANKLEGIESGAEVNVQANWNETDTTSDAYILNKPTLPDMTNYYTKSQVDSSQATQNTEIGSLADRGAKNLLKITATSQTVNGVTFTVNDDGTVTANGTSTAAITFTLNSTVGLESGSYVLSGCPSGGSWNNYYLTARSNGAWLSAPDFGTSAPINGTVTQVAISIQSGQTVNALTFKPMLCTAEDYSISPEFVPYAPTNRELYEEKIDHDIPTLTGSILDYATSLPTGLYFARHGSSYGPDKPETGKRYMYQIMKYTSATMTLIAYEGQGSNSNLMYMKNYTSNSWGPWVKFTGTVVS